MSQHCRANPCCGDIPCSGIPIPQHASGLTFHNPPGVRFDDKNRAIVGVVVDDPAVIGEMNGVKFYDPWHVRNEFPSCKCDASGTHQVTVVREVTTTYKFYVAPGQDPHEAFDNYVKAMGVQRIIRKSEPRKA